MTKHREADEFNVATGKALMFFRAKAGLTRKQVCEKLGITTQRYAHWEYGGSCISFYYVLEACDFFGVTSIDLLHRTMKETNENKSEI